MQKFQYSPLQPSEFRLLRVLPGDRFEYELLPATIGKAPAYYALSYRWGPSKYRQGRPTSAVYHITLNHILFEVCENLYDALDHVDVRLRESGCLIWIDAVCIDQQNLAERSRQVLHMRSIYEQARVVWIWLGMPFDRAENDMAVKKMKYLWTILRGAMEVKDNNVIAALATIHSDDPDICPQPRTDCYRAWQGITEIYEQDWWMRAWVYQEATSPNSQLFFCGANCFEWRHVFATTEIAGYLAKNSDIDKKFVRTISDGSAQRMWNFMLRREKTDEDLGLLEVLHRFRNTQSSEHRDKVYAPRGLAEDLPPGSLIPDYAKPVKEVFLDVVKACMVHPERALDFLGYCVREADDSINFKNLHASFLPSWVPDWRDRYTILPFPKQVKGQSTSTSPSSSSPELHKEIYNAGGRCPIELRIEEDTLKIQGFIIDSINQVSSIWEENVQNTSYLKSWTPKYADHTYHTGETIHEAFLHTIVADAYWDNNRTCSRGFSLDWSFLEANHVGSDEILRQERMTASARGPCFGRRFGQTQKAYLCLLPAAARVGDQIALFLGGPVLYVLRPVQSVLAFQYEFVGECYVHGLMDGQVLDWDLDQRGPKSEITLV